MLSDLISISHKHQTKVMVFVGDQSKEKINLLELNIEHKT
jgi:hypothetical protein